MRKPFTQVNVFSADPLGGNPLAVVHAAEELSEAQMAALARWTNLSETTFLLPPSDLVQHQWVDNGPGWCAVMLRTARQVLALEPDWALLDPLKLGVIGPHEAGQDAAFEVRAFIGGGGYEDPVTGSLNASLAQWLIGAGLAESSYVAAQGAALQRTGRVHLRKDGEEVWVGGDVVDVIRGAIIL